MQGAGGRRDTRSGTGVSDRGVEDQENGFDPFFTLSEGILHAEATQLRSWPPPMPASVRQFEEQLAAAEAELKRAILPDQALIEDAARRERQEWMASWMKSKPQESIARLKLKRDRWVPLDIPMSAKGISEMLENPYVQLVLSDPEQRNYWIYATGRTIFFFSSSVLSALLQINVAPTWNAFDYGANYRREVPFPPPCVTLTQPVSVHGFLGEDANPYTCMHARGACIHAQSCGVPASLTRRKLILPRTLGGAGTEAGGDERRADARDGAPQGLRLRVGSPGPHAVDCLARNRCCLRWLGFGMEAQMLREDERQEARESMDMDGRAALEQPPR